MNAAADAATEHDVALDLLAIIDESPAGRLVGSGETTIESVNAPEKTRLLLVLDNGQRYSIRIEEVGIGFGR